MTKEEALQNIKRMIGFSDTLDESIFTLFPELKESEDERIRKEILEDIRNVKAISSEEYRKKADRWIAWLEKQKENIEKEYVFRPLAGTDITIAAEQAIRRVNEGDRLVLAFNGAFIPVKKGCNVSTIVDTYDSFIEKPKSVKTPQWMIDFLNEIRPYSVNKEEYKDYDGSRAFEGKILTIIRWLEGYSIQQKEQKPNLSDSVGLEQKPAEWSKSDTLMCNAALEFLRSHPNLMASRGINKSSVIKWLKSFSQHRKEIIDEVCSKAGISMPYLDGNQWCILKGDDIQSGIVGFGYTKVDAIANFIKEAFIHKPKPAEWSEEDESYLKTVINEMEANKKEAREYEHKKYDTIISWLKSLQPQPKVEWSKEDRRKLNRIYEILGYAADDKGFLTSKRIIGDNEAIELQDFLKSLRPQPYWKPSEEQMEALRRSVFQKFITNEEFDVLETLYNDLKKL